MAVTFDEDENSPRGSLRDGKRQVVRSGNIDWGDLDAYIAELMPPSTPPFSPGVGAALPGNPFMRVVSFEFEPMPDTQITGAAVTGINTFEKAVFTIVYETPEFSFDASDQGADPIPFLSHSWEGGGEFLTLPNDGLLWLAEGDTVGSSVGDETNAGLFIPQIEHQITWHNVPDPPFSDIRDTIGKVNNAQVDFKTGAIAKETLLFLQPSLRREVMSDGSRAWEVSYKFSERRVSAEDQTAVGGWNHFYRTDPLQLGRVGFYRMQRETETEGVFKDVYEQTAFGVLFPS